MPSSNTTYLFDPDVFKELTNWFEIESELEKYKLVARPLRSDDNHGGYLDLLSQLTTVGEVSDLDFSQRFNEMKDVNQKHLHYLVVVIEDPDTKLVVAASTLFLEFKFIHRCALRGRLEDVVVSKSYRGKKIGELIVKIIVGLSKDVLKCYKLTLDCKDALIPFYHLNGFDERVNLLTIRF